MALNQPSFSALILASKFKMSRSIQTLCLRILSYLPITQSTSKTRNCKKIQVSYRRWGYFTITSSCLNWLSKFCFMVQGWVRWAKMTEQKLMSFSSWSFQRSTNLITKKSSRDLANWRYLTTMRRTSWKVKRLFSRLKKRSTHFCWTIQAKQDCRMKISHQVFTCQHQMLIQSNSNKTKALS